MKILIGAIVYELIDAVFKAEHKGAD
jgi:hypothetical protein